AHPLSRLFLYTTLFRSVAVVGVAVLFFMLIVNSYLVSSIVQPVSEINRAARQIALGDYDSRIAKKSDDEMGDLCDTINYMASEIDRKSTRLNSSHVKIS